MRVFLSHATADRKVAEALRDVLQADAPDLVFFLASIPGHIPAGEPWIEEVFKQLREADVYLVLLTPLSVQRRWIWFEVGAAWMSGKRRTLVCAAGLRKQSVEAPIGALQLLSLEEDGVEALHQVCDILGRSRLANVDTHLKFLISLIPTTIEEELREEGWAGVSVDGRFFAWDGPKLDSLRDESAEFEPPGLVEALRGAGVNPVMLNTRSSTLYTAERGARRVFLTDRRTYRRQIAKNELTLFVIPLPEPAKPTAGSP